MKQKSGRNWFRTGWVFVLCLVLILGMTGCGSASMDKAFEEMGAVEYSTSSKDMAPEASVEEALGGAAEAMQVGETNRKLIKTVDMRVETKEFDELLSGLSDQIASCNGYVEQMETYNGSIYNDWRSERSASMTIRIPEAQLENFLSAVSGLGNVIRRSDSVDDVTLAYVDLESHKAALQTEQSRLLELLKKAESVEDIITIESRLSEVRYQLESMESQLRTYDNKISYSTVYLDIEEVQELTPVEEETVWERISGGFLDSVHSVADGFVEFAIWLLVNSPFLVIWAVIILVIVLIGRSWSKKRFLKKAAGHRSAAGQNNAKAEAGWQEVSTWQQEAAEQKTAETDTAKKE